MTAAFSAAFAAGIRDPEVFFRMTPWQLGQVISGAVEIERKRWRLAMSTAWHAAGFQRSKRIPDLRSIMEQLDSPAEQQDRIRSAIDRAVQFAEAKKAAGLPTPTKPRKKG